MKFCFTLLSKRLDELKKARCKILPSPVLYGPLIVASLMLLADGATAHFCSLHDKLRQILYFDDLDG